ncbi:Polyadenylate-binding protein/Hyperplastic disc protein [Cubamyces lactineus]|nr:Polyadenylate-binding protein/Hyperplastic disc protein [Cubamyces lactineus]
MRFFSVASLPVSLAALAAAGPIADKRSSSVLQNGKDAQRLNAKFASLNPSSSCTVGEVACVQGAFAQCVDGGFKTTPCSGGLTCVALPLVDSPGTSRASRPPKGTAFPPTRKTPPSPASAQASAQKQKLGEVLFKKISASQPQLAGKITGILLELDNAEIQHLIEDTSALNARVQEAAAGLHKAGF